MLHLLLAEQPIERIEPNLTREIFGNIPHWSQIAFYLVAAAAVAVFFYGLLKRVRLWRQGKQELPSNQRPIALKRLLLDVVFHRRFRRRGVASLAHALLFGGFAVLLVGTTLIAVEHLLGALLGRAATDPVFHHGIYFGVFELSMDVAGICMLAGCIMFLHRRWKGAGSFARGKADSLILLLFIVIGITGYLVEGLRIIHEQTPLPALSLVGFACAAMLRLAGATPEIARQWHFMLWWAHAWIALGMIALFPYTRLLHAIAGVVSLANREDRLGVMHSIDLQVVEETGQIGVSSIRDFTRWQLVQLDACVSCGRCEDACPAFEAGKPLSPRNVVQDLATCLNSQATPAKTIESELPGKTVSEETLWSCTTCGACSDVCPLGVSPMEMITDMRRFLIGEGQLRGPPAIALQKTGRVGNPWGLAPNDRLKWAEGLDVPTIIEKKHPEFVYWIGCAAAYDRRIQKVARSVVKVLNAAGVEFAVLGPEESCTGESARRMGDELLFRELASKNIETLKRHDVQKIVSHCPHCVNSFRNDYSQLGAKYDVMHHSELLAKLLAEGRIPVVEGENPTVAGKVTYHDPCYLARANHVVDEPRAVLAAADSGASQHLVELPRNRSQTACCGGGGGRMWFDDNPEQRVGQGRIEEIDRSGATTVAVSCPFCLTMLSDGLAPVNPDVEVQDIAEILAKAIDSTSSGADQKNIGRQSPTS